MRIFVTNYIGRGKGTFIEIFHQEIPTAISGDFKGF